MLAIAMLAIALALQQPIQSLLHCASLQGEILVKRVELQLLSLANLTGFQLSLRGLPLFKEAGLRLMSLAKLPRAQLLPSPRGVLSVVSENPFLLCGTRDTCRLLFLLPPPTFPRTLGPLLLLLVLRRGTPLAQLRVEILLREPYARAFYDTTGFPPRSSSRARRPRPSGGAVPSNSSSRGRLGGPEVRSERRIRSSSTLARALHA